MRIGNDVAAGVYNHSRANRVLAHDECRLGFVLIALAQGPVSGDENLHHRRGNLRGQHFQRAIELHQNARRLVGFGFYSSRVGLWGGFLSRRFLAGLRLSGRDDCPANRNEDGKKSGFGLAADLKWVRHRNSPPKVCRDQNTIMGARP